MCIRDSGHAALGSQRATRHTQTDVERRQLGLHGRSVGAAQVLGEVVPSAAAVDPLWSRFGTGGVDRFLLRVVAVGIPHPFAHIAMHVIQAPGVGGKAAHGHGFLPVDARFGFQILL